MAFLPNIETDHLSRSASRTPATPLPGGHTFELSKAVVPLRLYRFRPMLPEPGKLPFGEILAALTANERLTRVEGCLSAPELRKQVAESAFRRHRKLGGKFARPAQKFLRGLPSRQGD